MPAKTRSGTGGYNEPRSLKKAIQSNQKLMRKTPTSKITTKVIDQKAAT